VSVVENEALGVPGFALLEDVAPIAPEPPVPDGSAPVKVIGSTYYSVLDSQGNERVAFNHASKPYP
jgi:hypothetical protein